MAGAFFRSCLVDALTANDLRQQSLAISEFNPSRATIGSEKCS
jgi:hypothetical protein